MIYTNISGLRLTVDTPPVLIGYKPVTLIDIEGNDIKDFVIPDDVTSIGTDAFSKCGGLQSITIPGSVTTISRDAFSWCVGLTDVYCYANDVPSTLSGVFDYSDLDHATLHVPAASIGDYKSQNPWRNFKNIVPLGDVDGISCVHKEKSDAVPYYDLQDRYLQGKPEKGVYIKNGKKYLVK